MRGETLIPAVAGGLSVTYLVAAVLAPGLLLGLVPVAVVACGALALLRRGGRSLALALVGILAFLVVGVVGASACAALPRGGLAWLLLVLFLLPLPVVPWLYWCTFKNPRNPTEGEDGGGLRHPLIPDPRSLTPGEGGGE